MPTSLTQESSFADINEAVLFYKTDLPNADIVDEEFCRWKKKWVGVPLTQHPQNLQDCLAPGICPLPNIRTLLQLFATLPLSTCSCERSGSALRRFNTYLRSTQSEDRLTAAALINVHYSEPISAQEVCQLFLQKHPRRIEASSMLFESSST